MFGSRKAIQLLAGLLAITLAGCNVPFRGGDVEPPASVDLESTPVATSAAVAPTVGLPAEVPAATQPSGASAIAHLEPEQLILITHIRMVTPSVGWGIGGFCPGPGIVALGAGDIKAAIFVLSMIMGMAGFELMEKRTAATRAAAAEATSAASGEAGAL